MSILLVDRSHTMWNAIFDDGKRQIRKEQCTSIPTHLNKSEISSSPDLFFWWAQKMRSGKEIAWYLVRREHLVHTDALPVN